MTVSLGQISNELPTGIYVYLFPSVYLSITEQQTGTFMHS